MESTNSSLKARLGPFSFPIRKIFIEESSRTYCMLNKTHLYAIGLTSNILFSLVMLGISLFFFTIITVLNIPIALIMLLIVCTLPILISLIDTYYFPMTFRFNLQKEFLFIRRGVISPRYFLLPYENIQDAQISDTLIDPIFKTSTIVVSTPADSLVIPAVPKEHAKAFRDKLLNLVKEHKDLAE
jgi:membrane protein YdbS with pleckstrin-like domain